MSSSSRAAALLAAFLASGCAATGRAATGVDLAALQVTPQRGQSADQARRDRYECHNWAVEQSGEVPPPPSDDSAVRQDSDRDKREERADRAIAGAAIGGVLGGLFGGRGWHDHNRNVLAGAAVGAAVGAGTQSREARDHEEAASAPPQSGYLRALSACLEGRGYSVALPPPPARAGRS